jgi:hypothetical protein
VTTTQFFFRAETAGSVRVEASQIACIKCESDIRYVTIVGVASVTAPTAVVAVGGDVVFTVTTTPPGFEHMLEWTATGEPRPMASQEGGATFTAHWDTPGSYVVTSACACVSSCDLPNPQSHASTTVAVVRVDIEQAELNVCQQMTEASLHLTGSYWAPEVEGDVIWSNSPTGLSGTGSGGTYTFNPSASTPGTYVVTARSSLLDNCHDTCIVRVLKVELFRDDACTKILDDWPAESGKPRSPKYVFGAENGIYVQVTGPAGLGNSYFTVKVTSEADTTGIHLHLHETSPGIYRNCNASGSEVLYLDKPTHVGTANDIYLKVLEEEVLPFTLKASGTEVCSTDVKTDRAEIGVEWQGEYATYDTSATLNTADDFTDGVYDHMGDANLVWAKEFNNGNLNSKEGHWDSGGDSSWADAVDFAVWCGHGHRVPAEGYMRFFVDLVGGVKQPANQLFWSEIDWGDLDVDWVILNTCNQLNGTDAELKVMANGVHLICGWRFWVCVGILCWPGRDLREARDAA